jgi:CheY-like chemotaxis protein
MSKFNVPELPSDDELGITDEDRQQHEDELPPGPPELSAAEVEALLGPSPQRHESAATSPTKRARRAVSREPRGRSAGDATSPRWRAPVTLAALVLIALVASSRTGIPRPVAANAPDSLFSSARAMATLMELARAPHPTGSPEHARVRGLLLERLRDLGLQPEVQTTTSVTAYGSQVRSATVRNIVARLPGTSPTGTVLITAHYDSREIAVGAADDGAGIVVVLEALRALRSGPPLANDVVVLLTDAEELGLLGARAFVDEHPWMADVDVVLSFEMRGCGGPSIMFETNDHNGWIIEALSAFDPAPFTTSLAFEVYRRMPNDTDFTPFREAGVQGLNFAAIDNAHVYHQSYDRPENLSEGTIQHHGLRAIAALRWLGEADLSDVNAPNRVYFSVPGLGLLSYASGWVHAISGLLAALFGLLLLVGARRGARPGAVVVSTALSTVLLGVAYFVGSTLITRLGPFHPELDSLHGSAFHSEGWYMLALGLGALGAVTLTSAIARRWITRDELFSGALAIPVLAGVALGIVAPLGAMHLQWPAIFAVTSALVASLLGNRATGSLGWLGGLALVTPTFLLSQPLVELLWLAMTLRLAGGLAVLLTLGLLLCLPGLEGLRAPNAWWAPPAASAAALLALRIGLAGAAPTAERPLPTTLVYVHEHGDEAAWWATSPAGADSESGQAALAWAESRAGGAFDETRDLSGLGLAFDRKFARGGASSTVPVRRAAVVDAPPPFVDILEDTVDAGVRLVTLGVRSEIGAEMLGFELTGDTRLLALNGRPLPPTVRSADHWGMPEDLVVLDLTMPAGDAIGVSVLEHLLRPQELLGSEPFARPANMAPDITRRSDRAVFRFSVGTFADPRHPFISPTTPSESAGNAAMEGVPNR